MVWAVFLRKITPALILYCGISAAQPGAARQAYPQSTRTEDPNITDFVPVDAKLIKQLRVDIDNDGAIAIVLAYGSDTVPDVTTGVRILKRDASGWAVVFEESDSVGNGAGASDAVNIEKVRSSSGKEGVVVVLKTSGAGTATDWHVLASVGDKIVRLDPTPIRDKVLKRRGYVFMGYNGVTVNGNLVIEDLAGYSYGRARCCPDLASIAIKSRFTGTSIKLDSVQELPPN